METTEGINITSADVERRRHTVANMLCRIKILSHINTLCITVAYYTTASELNDSQLNNNVSLFIKKAR